MFSFSRYGASGALSVLGLVKEAAPAVQQAPVDWQGPKPRPKPNNFDQDYPSRPAMDPYAQMQSAPPAIRNFRTPTEQAQPAGGRAQQRPQPNLPPPPPGSGGMAQVGSRMYMGQPEITRRRPQPAPQTAGNFQVSAQNPQNADPRLPPSSQGLLAGTPLVRGAAAYANRALHDYQNAGRSAAAGYQQASARNPGPLSGVHGVIGGVEGFGRGAAQNWRNMGNDVRGLFQSGGNGAQ